MKDFEWGDRGCIVPVVLFVALLAIVVVVRGLLGYFAGCCVTWVFDFDPDVIPKIRWGSVLAFIFLPMLLGGRSGSDSK